jgi:two-component system chemotaxis response regulator CheY
MAMPRLLVADDAVIIREIIKETARAAGWEIAGEAVNGAQAVEQFQQLRPDVVTLDMVMPDYDGRYALRAILDRDPQARVLVVSALDQRQVLHEAFKLGAADFLIKPFDKQTLVETLNRLVSSDATSA